MEKNCVETEENICSICGLSRMSVWMVWCCEEVLVERGVEITVRPHHLTLLPVWVMQIAHETDLDTAGRTRRRGRTGRSRSLRPRSWSWRGRDQYSRWAWECRAWSPACPRGQCRPSRWPAPRGPCPGGRSRRPWTGPWPSGEQTRLAERRLETIVSTGS